MVNEKEKGVIDNIIESMVYILNLTDETSDTSIITIYKETRQSIQEWITVLNAL